MLSTRPPGTESAKIGSDVKVRYEESEQERFAAGKPVYRLGRISFTVDNSDAAFEPELARLLPRCRRGSEPIHELAATDVRGLLSKVLELHAGYLWISAACLLSPQGHMVLISGQSSAGKSTTALALALKHGWRVISEDLTCIDIHAGTIVVFASPLSLKIGALELLQNTIAMLPQPLVRGEWVPLSNIHAEGEYEAGFDLALYFGLAGADEPMRRIACSSGEYVRLLLPCSNLVHHESGPDKLAKYVKSAPCYRVTGGSLSERMNLILEWTTGKARL